MGAPDGFVESEDVVWPVRLPAPATIPWWGKGALPIVGVPLVVLSLGHWLAIALVLFRREGGILRWVLLGQLSSDYLAFRRGWVTGPQQRRARRLRERAAALLPLVSEEGEEGWLTPEGLVDSKGGLTPWQEILSYQAEDAPPGTMRLLLSCRRGQIEGTLSMQAGSCAVGAAGAAVALTRPPRARARLARTAAGLVLARDLLALAVFGAGALHYRRKRRTVPYRVDLLVNTQRMPRAAVEAMLRRHLGEPAG